MRLNNKFASTFFTGLFVTTCLLTPALAQEKSFQPQGAWALTKVDRSAQGGNSYCTLSRKYDDNVVVSLGRNQTEEYSLAIDFQKPVFEKGQSLKINLQPGPGQIRAYDMMPTSEKAVVVRLGWDTGFFDTLNSSQNMKVKIGEQSYAFAMPEVAKGQQELKECMEGLQAAAKGGAPAATTDVLAAAPSSSSNDFSAGKVEEKIAAAQAAKPDIAAQEAKVLSNFAASIKAQEPALKSADKLFLSDQRQENPEVNAAKREDKVAMAAPASPAPVPPQKPKTELVKRPTASDDAMKLAALETAAGEKAAKSDAELKALQTRLKTISKENESLKQETAADLEKSNKQTESLQKRLAEIAKENETLKKKSATISPETKKQMDAIEVEKKALEERLVAAEQEKAKLSVQQVTIAQRTKELEEKNAKLEQELRSSQAQIAEATTLASNQKNEQLKTLQTRLAQIAAENENLKAKSESISPETQKQMDAIAAEKAALQQKLVLAEKEKAAAKEMAEKNAELQKSMTDLRAKAEASAKAQAEAKAMEERIAAIKAENEKLKEKASGISPEAQKKIEAAEAEKKALEEKLAAAKTETAKQAEAQKALETLQAEKKALEEKLASANADSAKKAIEISAQAEAAKQAATMTAMPGDDKALETVQAEKKALEAKLKATEEKLKQAEAAPKVGGDVETKLSELEIRNKQLEDSLRASQTRIGEAAINTETKALRKIADLELKLEAAQKDNSVIAKQLESYRTQQEDGRLSLVAGDWDLEQATKRFNEAEREIRRLGQEVEKERMSCNREKSEIEQMLFDPAVTEQKQIEKLRALEEEIAALKEGRGGNTSARVASAPLDTSVEIQAIEPAAGTPEQMGSMEWSSQTPKASLAMKQDPVKEAHEAAVLATAAGTAQAARERSETERLRRQLERAEMQKATFQNQLAKAQATPEATQADEQLLAERLNELQPTAGGAAYAPPKPQPAKAKAETAAYSPANIKTLLQKAGVSAGGFKKASSGASGDNFTWSQGAGMTGLASVKKGGSFDTQVKQYLDQQKSRCNGDFASMPSPSSGGGKKTALYEVACVSGSGSTSNSIVFYEDQGKFVAISNQTDATNMDAAMDARDKIAAAIAGM